MRLILTLSSALFASLWLAGPVKPAQNTAPGPGQLALGDSVFRGLAGASLCYVCHGPQGKGVDGLGPNLTDKEWLHGDGSVASIEKIVTEGVPKPKKMASPMPPRGGGTLTESQIKAVAAYVYSISHPAPKP